MAQERDNSPQPVLLGLLMTQPRHGYELYQEFNRALGEVWRIGLSRLYAQLGLMEKAGWIAAQTEPQPNRPARKVYHITAAGREVFLDWVSRPTPYLRQMRMELLARLFFHQHLALPGLDAWIAAQKAVCQEQAALYARSGAEAQGFRRLVLDFRRGQLEAVIPWLDRCLETLAP